MTTADLYPIIRVSGLITLCHKPRKMHARDQVQSFIANFTWGWLRVIPGKTAFGLSFCPDRFGDNNGCDKCRVQMRYGSCKFAVERYHISGIECILKPRSTNSRYLFGRVGVQSQLLCRALGKLMSDEINRLCWHRFNCMVGSGRAISKGV